MGPSNVETLIVGKEWLPISSSETCFRNSDQRARPFPSVLVVTVLPCSLSALVLILFLTRLIMIKTHKLKT